MVEIIGRMAGGSHAQDQRNADGQVCISNKKNFALDRKLENELCACD